MRRIGWLRAPEALHEPTVQVIGDSIHIISSTGRFLSLSRRPLDVVRWRSLRSFMLPDRSVSDVYYVPPGRYLWAQLKEPAEDAGLAVIDVEEWRVSRRINGFDIASPVAGARPARVLATSIGRVAGLYNDSGASVEPSLKNAWVIRAVAHPEGRGLLALVAAWDPDDLGDPYDEDDENTCRDSQYHAAFRVV